MIDDIFVEPFFRVFLVILMILMIVAIADTIYTVYSIRKSLRFTGGRFYRRSRGSTILSDRPSARQ